MSWINPVLLSSIALWEQDMETSSRLWCCDPFPPHHDPQLTAKPLVGPQGDQSRNEDGDSSNHLIGYRWSSVSDGMSFVLYSLWLCHLHAMFRCLEQLLLFTAKLSLCVSHIQYPLSLCVRFTVCLVSSSSLVLPTIKTISLSAPDVSMSCQKKGHLSEKWTYCFFR